MHWVVAVAIALGVLLPLMALVVAFANFMNRKAGYND